jgi:hypothetical protein
MDSGFLSNHMGLQRALAFWRLAAIGAEFAFKRFSKSLYF